MGRYTDYSPVKETCPKIDSVINYLNGIEWDNDESGDEAYLPEILATMEEIRAANLAMRNWGNELYREKEDIENERDELQRQIGRLESQVKDLEREIENIEA